MKWFKILMLSALGFAGFATLEVNADIYSWTDENGVRYFTNYAPPKQAKLLMKTPEIAYDEEADLQRREKEELEAARQELAEREAFLQEQQQAAERRIAEANARAEAALREADRILQDAEAAAEDVNNDNSSNYAYGYYSPYYGYRYPRKIHYKDYYYYYHGGLHHKRQPYKHKPTLYNRFVRKFSVDHRPNASRSPVQSHRQRVTTFRGRQGLY
ncbi:MAG: hypothetical protein P8X68_08720 [Desulfobacterales bacterium]|jgi:membrane-bound lytic murein transglycosylase